MKAQGQTIFVDFKKKSVTKVKKHTLKAKSKLQLVKEATKLRALSQESEAAPIGFNPGSILGFGFDDGDGIA